MNRQLQLGFSVIELMIAMALSMVLMAGVLSIFASSKLTYLTNEKTSRVQEGGRMALDMIMRDIRSAGYVGCAKAVPFNTTLNSATAPLWDYSQPMRGFEYTGPGTWSPALGTALVPAAQAPQDGSDAILLHVAQREGVALVMPTALASSTANPQIAGATPAPVAGQIMMITDCNASTVFEVTNYTSPSVAHAVSTGATPQNATDDLGYVYQAGARLIPMQTVIYYVRGDALWRRVGDATPEQLVDGVQALQIVYGEDTNSDRIVDNYVAASAVGNWANIVSVSVSLLVQSDAVGNDIDRATYNLLGTNVGPFNDRRLRMLFTTTAALRNVAI
jgi:type IV pilus assembly protein PilW